MIIVNILFAGLSTKLRKISKDPPPQKKKRPNKKKKFWAETGRVACYTQNVMLLRRQIPQQQRQDDRDEPVKFKVASGWWYP